MVREHGIGIRSTWIDDSRCPPLNRNLLSLLQLFEAVGRENLHELVRAERSLWHITGMTQIDPSAVGRQLIVERALWITGINRRRAKRDCKVAAGRVNELWIGRDAMPVQIELVKPVRPRREIM